LFGTGASTRGTTHLRIRRRPFAPPHAALDRNGTQTSDSVLPVTGETPAEPTEVNSEW